MEPTGPPNNPSPAPMTPPICAPLGSSAWRLLLSLISKLAMATANEASAATPAAAPPRLLAAAPDVEAGPSATAGAAPGGSVGVRTAPASAPAAVGGTAGGMPCGGVSELGPVVKGVGALPVEKDPPSFEPTIGSLVICSVAVATLLFRPKPPFSTGVTNVCCAVLNTCPMKGP